MSDTQNTDNHKIDDTVKLVVDHGICAICGTCTAMYPEYFQQNPDGTINDSKAIVPKDKSNEIKDACPVGAIKEM